MFIGIPSQVSDKDLAPSQYPNTLLLSCQYITLVNTLELDNGMIHVPHPSDNMCKKQQSLKLSMLQTTKQKQNKKNKKIF